MFAVVLDCVLCNLSTAAFLSERERACTGILAEQRTHRETAGYHRAQAGGGQRRKAGQRQGQYFLSAPFTQSLTFTEYMVL